MHARCLRLLLLLNRYESQRDAIVSQNFNMESTQLTTDNLRNTMATVDAMKLANKEMKKQYGKIDVNKIEVRSFPLNCLALLYPNLVAHEQNLQDDMEDLMEQANEIQESMNRNYAVPDDLDEADLEAGEIQGFHPPMTQKLRRSNAVLDRTGCAGGRA